MPLQLQRVTTEERPVLENLLQLYLHEMSRFSPQEIGDDGRFEYAYLDKYFSDPDRHPFLVRLKGRPAGFVMVRNLDTIGPRQIHSVAEFFILESYRRLGMGEEIARRVFDEFEGNWQIGVTESNTEAEAFWHKVIYRYTAKQYKVTRITGWNGPVFEFGSPGPKLSDPVVETSWRLGEDASPQPF